MCGSGHWKMNKLMGCKNSTEKKDLIYNRWYLRWLLVECVIWFREEFERIEVRMEELGMVC